MPQPRSHTVQPGEHLCAVAAKYGLTDWKTVWDANADIARRRKNPNLLCPGDVLTVPVAKEQKEGAETEKHHRIEAELSPLCLRLEIVDPRYRALADREVKLSFRRGEAFGGRTDDRGRIAFEGLPRNSGPARLVVSVGRFSEELELRIGALPPLLEETDERQTWIGVQQRLWNLGFYDGEISGLPGRDAKEALRRFRIRAGLSDSDALDEAVQRRLLEVHDQAGGKPKMTAPREDEPVAERRPGAYGVAPDFEKPLVVNLLVLRGSVFAYRLRFHYPSELKQEIDGKLTLLRGDGFVAEPARSAVSDDPPWFAYDFDELTDWDEYTMKLGGTPFFENVLGRELREQRLLEDGEIPKIAWAGPEQAPPDELSGQEEFGLGCRSGESDEPAEPEEELALYAEGSDETEPSPEEELA